MKNPARGSLLIFAALIVSLFYLQPQVGTASFIADQRNSQENLLQLNNKITADSTETVLNEDNLDDTNKLIDNKIINAADKNAIRSFSATAYCLKGRTANGGSVRRGIVAADPRVLPLGTKIQLSGGGFNGTYTVTDTGGAIKGRKLDIWVPSCSEAVRFGRKSVSVNVLGK